MVKALVDAITVLNSNPHTLFFLAKKVVKALSSVPDASNATHPH